MRTIGGRIGLALLAFGLITLVTVGGALWVVLRDLHRDAALGSLAELTLPYASQARQRVPQGFLRRTERGERPDQDILRVYRESVAGRAATRAFTSFVQQAQDEISTAGISVLLISDGSTVIRDPASGTSQVVTGVPLLAASVTPGQVQTGTTEVAGLGDVLYAATPIREALLIRAVPTLMLVREDDFARLASDDLIRALSVAALVLLVIGTPLAVGLSRSVAAPLRRLAAASGVVARGVVPEPLPTSGPREVAEASAAFNAMAAEVEATRRAQQQLLADVRHDLRTPLTVIAGFSEALRDGTAASGPAAERAATAISDEAGRLERMLADLDHLTISGAATPSLRLEELDGGELARAAVERFAGEADARGQTIVLASAAAASRPTPLLADRDAVDRILANLIANALAFAPSPGGHVGLEVEAVSIPAASGRTPGRSRPGEPPGVLIAVRDDGPGIPPAALAHVFDRFYRADPARASRGSGLGLAIVRDLAEALGGYAFAENIPGGGARVGVVLPAATPAGPAPAGPASTSP